MKSNVHYYNFFQFFPPPQAIFSYLHIHFPNTFLNTLIRIPAKRIKEKGNQALKSHFPFPDFRPRTEFSVQFPSLMSIDSDSGFTVSGKTDIIKPLISKNGAHL